MNKIQPEQGSSKSTPRNTPNGWAKAPHAVTRDSTLSPPARLLWVILEGRKRQGQPYARVGRKALALDLGVSVRSVGQYLSELEKAGLLTVKRTGRTSIYLLTEIGNTVPLREEACFPSTEQEQERKKKAKQVPALSTDRALSTAQTFTLESLNSTATALTPMRAEMLLLSLPAQQRPALTKRTLEVLGRLFDMGYSEPEVLAHLKETITNPNARAGLTVETLEALAQIPHRESTNPPQWAADTTTEGEAHSQPSSPTEPLKAAEQAHQLASQWLPKVRAQVKAKA